MNQNKKYNLYQAQEKKNKLVKIVNKNTHVFCY